MQLKNKNKNQINKTRYLNNNNNFKRINNIKLIGLNNSIEKAYNKINILETNIMKYNTIANLQYLELKQEQKECFQNKTDVNNLIDN